MIKYRFLVSACIGTFFYVLVSFIGGRDGLWAEDQMLEQKRLLSANAAQIEKTNEELSLEKTAFLQDRGVIASYAHRLGYISEGEKLIKINGLDVEETQITDAGNILMHKDPEYISEKVCKGIGLISGLIFYLIFLLVDLSRGKISVSPVKKRFAKGVSGIPVYDM